MKEVKSTESQKKFEVNSEGQTVIDAGALLKSARVQKFIKEFGPKVQHSIQETLKTTIKSAD